MFRLYLVTDRTRTRERPLLDVVEQALRGGVEAVQLREKDLSGRALLELAQQLRTLCSRYRASLLINDRVDIALAAAADGVHLPGTSFTPAVARQLLGLDALIGASAHSLSEARAAADSGADFLVFGPVFDTPSKRSFGPPLGLAALAEVTRAVSVPVLAIGGINAERCRSVRQCGAHGVALIREILEAVDPRAAARAVRAALG